DRLRRLRAKLNFSSRFHSNCALPLKEDALRGRGRRWRSFLSKDWTITLTLSEESHADLYHWSEINRQTSPGRRNICPTGGGRSSRPPAARRAPDWRLRDVRPLRHIIRHRIPESEIGACSGGREPGERGVYVRGRGSPRPGGFSEAQG